MKTIFTNQAIATIILILSIDYAYCQVGVDTSNPQGIFHVDGKKNNPSTGSPSASQALDDFVVKASGNVGIGTTTPGSKIEINSGLANTSGLRLTQLNTSSPSVNNIKTGVLGVDANGNVVVTKVVDPAVAPCVQGFAFIYEDAVGSSGTISDGTKANALTKKSDPQNIYNNGNFSLKAGDTYRLEAAFFNSYTAADQNVAFSYEWYNETDNVALPIQNMPRATVFQNNNADYTGIQPYLLAFITPTKDIQVSVRFRRIQGTGQSYVLNCSYMQVQQVNPCGQ